MYQKDHQKIKIAIGKTIQKYRDEMNLTQTQLSILVYGKEAQLTVSKSELGNRNIPAQEILNYIKAFRVKPDEFFKKVQIEFSRLK